MLKDDEDEPSAFVELPGARHDGPACQVSAENNRINDDAWPKCEDVCIPSAVLTKLTRPVAEECSEVF